MVRAFNLTLWFCVGLFGSGLLVMIAGR